MIPTLATLFSGGEGVGVGGEAAAPLSEARGAAARTLRFKILRLGHVSGLRI